jgi:hypothetical protein
MKAASMMKRLNPFRNSNEPDKTNLDLICYHLANSNDHLK